MLYFFDINPTDASDGNFNSESSFEYLKICVFCKLRAIAIIDRNCDYRDKNVKKDQLVYLTVVVDVGRLAQTPFFRLTSEKTYVQKLMSDSQSGPHILRKKSRVPDL